MMRTRAWISGFGLAALCGSVIALVACGGGDDNNGGTGGSGNQGKGGTTTGSGGTTTGSGGATTGSGGASTAGSTGTAGAGTTGPFACAGKAANCSSIGDFPAGSGQVWGSGDFSGGISVFGAGLMRDATKTDALHITGPVKNYGYGFNLWFTACSNISAFTGVSFKISGTAGTANTIDFQPQTNSDYPWQPSPTDKKGGCTATDATNPWGECVAPGKSGIAITTTPTVVALTWADITGGKPVAWSATMSPTEIIGLQWQFPWSGTATEYNVDITIDEITLTGGTQMACPTGSSTGTGGASGTGGGSNGGATASGGAGGGSNGGASNGGASTAGASNAGASNGGAAGSSSGGAGGAAAGASNGGAAGSGTAGNAGAAGGSGMAAACATFCNGADGIVQRCMSNGLPTEWNTEEKCRTACASFPGASLTCWQTHLTNMLPPKNESPATHCPHATGATGNGICPVR